MIEGADHLEGRGASGVVGVVWLAAAAGDADRSGGRRRPAGEIPSGPAPATAWRLRRAGRSRLGVEGGADGLRSACPGMVVFDHHMEGRAGFV